MIANGHNRTEIYEDYSPDEINLYYAACLARKQEVNKDAAISARVAQATEKGWKDYTRSVDEAIRSLVLPKPDTKQLRNDKAMGAFFQALAKAKGKHQLNKL